MIKSLHTKYNHMKERCANPNNKRYDRYGGRGIKVCEEWLNDYYAFEKWALENGWREGLAIDRIDNDGNYEPTNCRFVTTAENNQNRRTSRFYTYQGRTMNLMQWCNELNLNYHTIKYRLIRGWTFEHAITEPIIKRNRAELNGQRFGRLVVLKYAGDEYIGKDNNSRYVCKCDCGNEVIVGANKLKIGHTKSCGCLQKEKAKKRMETQNPMKKENNSPI